MSLGRTGQRQGGAKFLTLGIETSCDDTALAFLEGDDRVVGDVISSQVADHSPFGGVLPELASRKHQEALLPLLRSLFSSTGLSPRDVDLIAVTAGPGLMGSLLVGVMSAKGLAQAWGVPIIGVNHLEGHIFANVLAHPELSPPFLCLIVSGGHTEIVLARGGGEYTLLGATRDDAAGEAYDKAAKLLGLGYPGGPAIERLARHGNPEAFDFPLGMKGSGEVEFSFSGLKTSLRTAVQKLLGDGASVVPAAALPVADICASFQRAVTEALTLKLRLAVRKTSVKRVALSGGVAANEHLRTALVAEGAKRGWEVFLPPRSYCTDNAIMIAAAGRSSYARGLRSDLSMTPDPSWQIWRSASDTTARIAAAVESQPPPEASRLE
ncbi:MAG: tRNA (adenosine(37)-N6)-threonylcarbamoyltransferase complex transferase subunit TsaD [Synergistaceae bacterium]|nr:tRNA (adenosine(37)-N6)-threonylcarbamoyltransferase complex transferase subunit TsaD [Synergistaceae bacterium]